MSDSDGARHGRREGAAASHTAREARRAGGRDPTATAGVTSEKALRATAPGEGPVEVRGRLTRPLRISFLLRGAALWVAIHLASAFVGAYAAPTGFSFIQVVFVLLIVYVGVRVDQRVRREHLLLGNAGVPPWTGPVHAVAAAALLESVVQVGARLAGVGGGG